MYISRKISISQIVMKMLKFGVKKLPPSWLKVWQTNFTFWNIFCTRTECWLPLNYIWMQRNVGAAKKIFQFQRERERERGTTLLINQIVLIFHLKFLLSASHEALTCKILSWTTLATLSWHHLSFWKTVLCGAEGNEDQFMWNCINILEKHFSSKVQGETYYCAIK